MRIRQNPASYSSKAKRGKQNSKKHAGKNELDIPACQIQLHCLQKGDLRIDSDIVQAAFQQIGQEHRQQRE